MSSCKVKEFCLAVLYDETRVEEDFGHNVVATK